MTGATHEATPRVTINPSPLPLSRTHTDERPGNSAGTAHAPIEEVAQQSRHIAFTSSTRSFRPGQPYGPHAGRPAEDEDGNVLRLCYRDAQGNTQTEYPTDACWTKLITLDEGLTSGERQQLLHNMQAQGMPMDCWWYYGQLRLLDMAREERKREAKRERCERMRMGSAKMARVRQWEELYGVTQDATDANDGNGASATVGNKRRVDEGDGEGKEVKRRRMA